MTVAAFDHHDSVVMTPAAMPAMVAMLAEFGAGAVITVMTTTLDHHRLGTCQSRRRDDERAESRNHMT